MRIALEGEEVRIGRWRAGSGEPIPDIDLAGAVEDPGVSRLHALLVRQEDDGWAIRDLGSTNGTTVNDDLEAVGTDASVPLAEGDRIHLGVWTTITLRRRWRRSEVVEGDNPGAQRL
jgi:pSer/pThr/pTyr-binding forkhead associated (FHA) protein